MGTAPKLTNPGLTQYVQDIREGKLKIIDRESIETIFVNLCFNRKYRKNKENQALIQEFVNKTLENEEFVGVRTMESIVNNFDVEDNIQTINIPTLILTGDGDAFILPVESQKMHEKIPNSKLVVFSPKVGHMINYEATEDYRKVLEEFLETL